MRKRLPLLIILIIYVVYSLLSFKSFGITNDEPEDYLLGSFLYTKLRADDPVLERSFVIAADGAINLAMYDRIYMALQYAIAGEINYDTYHLLNLLFFSIILIAAYELLLKETGRTSLATIGPIALFLTPRLFGDIAANHKDVPFAISYFVSLVAIYLFGNKNSAKYLLILGLFFGLTQSLRTVGYSIYLVYVLWLLFNRATLVSFKKIFEILAQVAVIFFIGLLIHFVTLPYLAADPFSRFAELLTNAKAFPWNNAVLYFGTQFLSTELPWHYVPIWFLITTPILFLVYGLLSVKLISKSKLARLLWLSLFVNSVLLVLSQPVLYDGVRHLLFLLPPFVLLACLSFFALLKSKWRWKKIALSLTALNVVLILVQYSLLFPFHYIYFNEVIGYLPGANNRFELDYWGASYKSAVEQFNQRAQFEKTYQLYFCGDPQQVKAYARFKYELVYEINNADLLICHRRGNNQTTIDTFDSKNQFAIKRLGVPLTTVKWTP